MINDETYTTSFESIPDGIPINIREDYSSKHDSPQFIGIFGTTVNLLNSILGAGVLAVPNSFVFCGLVPTVVMITLVAALSYVSAAMIVKIQGKTGIDSLSSLAKDAFGTTGAIILGISSVLFCYSCMIAYLIMGTGILQSWCNLANIDTNSPVRRGVLVLVYSVAIPIALTIPKKLSILSVISSFAVISLIFFALAMFYEGIHLLPKQGISPTAETGVASLGIFNALAIHSLSLALAVVIMPIISKSEKNYKKRYFSSGTAFYLSYVIVMVPGVIGYLIFGADTKSVVLDNFPDEDLLFIIVRAAYFIILCTSYPVLGLSVLNAITLVLYKNDDPIALPWKQRIVGLVIENSIPLLIAIFLPDVRPAMSIGGAIGGGLSNFIFPPLLWIKYSCKPYSHWGNVLCLLFAGFGIIACAISTYQSVVDAIASFS